MSIPLIGYPPPEAAHDDLKPEYPTTPHQPSTAMVRALRRTCDGRVEVLVNHRVDGELVEHRAWPKVSRWKSELLAHVGCPGEIVGAYVDGRAVPL